MKLQIAEPGLEGYSGPLSTVNFTDGVSDRDVTELEAACIGAIMRVRAVDSGRQVGPGQILVDSYSERAPVQKKQTRASDKEEAREEGGASAPGSNAPAPNRPELRVYSEKELLEIAEKRGINGLREISQPLGAKANSIRDLVKRILHAQTVKVAKGEVRPVSADEVTPEDPDAVVVEE